MWDSSEESVELWFDHDYLILWTCTKLRLSLTIWTKLSGESLVNGIYTCSVVHNVFKPALSAYNCIKKKAFKCKWSEAKFESNKYIIKHWQVNWLSYKWSERGCFWQNWLLAYFVAWTWCTKLRCDMKVTNPSPLCSDFTHSLKSFSSVEKWSNVDPNRINKRLQFINGFVLIKANL